MDHLDLNFIRRAERVTSFNITTKDFESLRYKREIQHLINKHFFPDFDLSRTLQDVDARALNQLIDRLKREDRSLFESLHNYPLKGVGPGEATLYFLIDTAHLGGGSSAGVDLVVGSRKYEVKAAKVTREGTAKDFKLGGNVPLASIQVELNALREKLRLEGTRTEMKGSVIDKMRKSEPTLFSAIESKFKKAAAKYFAGHEVIFINNNKSSEIGSIAAVKHVKENDITIERVTAGTIKPVVVVK